MKILSSPKVVCRSLRTHFQAPSAALTTVLAGVLALTITRPAGAGVPAYDAQPMDVPVPSPYDNFIAVPRLNPQGAFAFTYYDTGRGLNSIGRWTPSAMYGQSAGYQELYTYSSSNPGAWILLSIEDNGDVSYAAFQSAQRAGRRDLDVPDSVLVNFGGARGGGSASWDSIPGFSDHTPQMWGWSQDLAIQQSAGSDADPFPFGWGTYYKRAENGGPFFDLTTPLRFQGGLQSPGGPGGAFQEPMSFNNHGGSVWRTYDVHPLLPGRQPDLLNPHITAVTPGGSFPVPGNGVTLDAVGNFIYFRTADGSSGAGSVADFEIHVASPLGGLAPGTYSQSSIPGMPPSHRVEQFNSSGAFIIRSNTNPVTRRMLVGGKSAAFADVFPPVVFANNPDYVVEALNEAGLLTISPFHISANGLHREYDGRYLLTPTMECDYVLNPPSPLHVGTEFDLDVTVKNITSGTLTNVRLEGDTPGSPGLFQYGFPTFDVLSGPAPPGPLSLAAGATTLFRYHCKTSTAGAANASATVRASGPTGRPLRAILRPALDVIQFADLQIKKSDEPNSSFAIPGVYQKSQPSGLQVRKVKLAADADVASFDVKVVNDEPTARALRLVKGGGGSPNIPIRFIVGAEDITPYTVWDTPTLAPGGSLIVRVEFGPTPAAASGDTTSTILSVVPDNSSAVLDIVKAEVVKAPPIAVTLRGPSTGSLTPESIEAGKAHIDAELVFKTDTASLAVAPKINRGLVADGVTPLLFEMKVPPANFEGLEDSIEYNVALELVSGGAITRGSVGGRLRILHDGVWTSERKLTFTAAQDTMYGYLPPIDPDILQFSGAATELKLRLHFTLTGAGTEAGQKEFYLRKPPVALVHGYNTNGDWGDAFSGVLASSRPRFNTSGGEDFIRTIRYGQMPANASDSARNATTWTFGNLVSELARELKSSMAALGPDWAFTRHDVVAHSQGGVLTRLLCSQNGNAWLSVPFRNSDNFYRGRFHRVVTIGSPHNGSRILGYMLKLRDRLSASSSRVSIGVSALVSEFMVLQGSAQDKFDPFGPQIRSINISSPSAPWYPDPDASFHLVQTTIDSGNPPDTTTYSFAELATGLNINGAVVLPHGSDGVVDFDSMGAYTPEAGQVRPSNVFRLPANLQIAHAFVSVPAGASAVISNSGNLFDGDSGQVDSAPVAHHVIGALDQSPAIPAADRVFGTFQLPAYLPQSVGDQIQAAADLITPGALETIRLVDPEAAPAPAARGVRGPGDVVSANYEFVWDSTPIIGPVFWSAERYGIGGINYDGITLVSDPENPLAVSVQYDGSIPGDVVLFASAADDSGNLIIGKPVVVASIEPDPEHYTPDSLHAVPDGGAYAAGTAIEPQFWVTYHHTDDGPDLVMQRWIVPEDIQGNVFDVEGIMDTQTNPLVWRFLISGTTTLYAYWREMWAEAYFTVFDPAGAGMDSDTDGVGDIIEDEVPGLNAGSRGDGNGDGIQDRDQFGIASLPFASGWQTFDVRPRIFFGLKSTQLPANPPPDISFDQGIVTLNIAVELGELATVKIHFPSSQTGNVVWAFGPTAGNPDPHWVEFTFDGTTGAQISGNDVTVRVVDGGRGDADGEVNYVIRGVTFAVGHFAPAPPLLAMEFDLAGRPVLIWPAVFPNAAHTYLEASDDLSAWQFVPNAPYQNAGYNLLSDPSADRRRFYRLRSQ